MYDLGIQSQPAAGVIPWVLKCQILSCLNDNIFDQAEQFQIQAVLFPTGKMMSTKDMLKYIEGRGGDVNSAMKDNPHKWTPLRFAVEHKNLAMASALLEAGADVR